MKHKMMLLAGVAALGLIGCAHDDRHHSETYSTTVVTDSNGSRTYVREYETDYNPHYQNNMEPRVRDKHAESLGWNTESYYRQRGYH
jgi:hypothetical protein